MKQFILMMVLVLSFSAMSEVKVGIVNIQKVITSIKAGKGVMKTLEKSFKSKQKQLKKEEADIKKLQMSIQKQASLLSKTALAKKDKEMRTKIQALQQKTMQFQKEIQKQEADLKKPILDKLKPIIDEVSKEMKVALTFEKSASPVVYAESEVDITEAVIKAYDKKH
jgi:outer membrane protein